MRQQYIIILGQFDRSVRSFSASGWKGSWIGVYWVTVNIMLDLHGDMETISLSFMTMTSETLTGSCVLAVAVSAMMHGLHCKATNCELHQFWEELFWNCSPYTQITRHKATPTEIVVSRPYLSRFQCRRAGHYHHPLQWILLTFHIKTFGHLVTIQRVLSWAERIRSKSL